MDDMIVKLMTDIWTVFINLCLKEGDVIFPDRDRPDHGRELPDNVFSLLTQQGLSTRAIALIKRLPYLNPASELWELHFYPVEAGPMDWLHENRIRCSRILNADDPAVQGRGTLNPDEITLVYPWEDTGNHIILDLEEGTIRKWNYFEAGEWASGDRQEIEPVPFPDSIDHYRNEPPSDAIEFLQDWMEDLITLQIIPCFTSGGHLHVMTTGPNFEGEDKVNEDTLSPHEKFHVALKKKLIQDYKWDCASIDGGPNFRRADWRNNANQFCDELTDEVDLFEERTQYPVKPITNDSHYTQPVMDRYVAEFPLAQKLLRACATATTTVCFAVAFLAAVHFVVTLPRLVVAIKTLVICYARPA